MDKIVFIAPDEETARLFREVAQSMREDRVIVWVGFGQERVTLARKAVREGADVIISRWVMQEMKEEVPVPLVNVPLTGYDIARALEQAKQFGSRVAIVAPAEIVSGAITLSRWVGVELAETRGLETSSDEELLEAVAGLQGKADVLVGGARAASLGARYGMHGLLIHAGEEALRTALAEAQRIIPVRRRERERAEWFRAILEFAYDGIVAVDYEDRVTVFNRMAEEITGFSATQVLGKPIKSVMPGARLNGVIASGKPELGRIEKLGSVQVATNRVPIVVGGQVVGAVATILDISRIQGLEQKIRKRLHAQGHVARLRFEDVVGESPAFAAAVERARRFSRTDSSVLITGETGTGKEVLAQSIHNASRRREGPFVAVNCAALPESLLESELFGYVEGAFTGARKEGKTGLFELAHRGTIFLDEIAEVPLRLQARFLRVLQEREVTRLGDDKVIPVDVRVIAATNRDLEDLVERGRFREDLYFRLNILNLRVPPLRERPGDVVLLFRYFLARYEAAARKRLGVVTPELEERLRLYQWPGNVRELENLVERLVVLWDGHLSLEEIDQLLSRARPNNVTEFPRAANLRDLERQAIVDALRKVGGNRKEAARRLGVSVTTLWRRVKRWDLQV